MTKSMKFGLGLAALAIAATMVGATALTANRDTPEREGSLLSFTQASNHIYAGSMVCENGSAVVVPAADASGYVVVGRAEKESDNTGSAYSSTATIEVRRGVFRWANGGSFTVANVGDLAYVADDATVTTAASATYDVVAGVIVDVDSSGVWVDSFAIGGQGAASVTTLAASGAAALSSTLAVSGNTTLGGTLTVVGASSLTGAVTVVGALTATIPVQTAVNMTATNRVCTSADYGKIIVINTNDIVTITLPANGAAVGSSIDFMTMGSDSCAPTIAAATADTLVGPNDPDLDSVTFATGHRMGAYVRFISDGSFWHVFNLGTTTMSGND